MELNLRRNSLYAVGEVVVSGLTLFFLYKKVVSALGVEALGVWSLVLATTSLGRLVDVGAASGLSRFVAAAKARNNASRELIFVQTAVITNAALYLGIALVLWVPAYFGLSWVMKGAALSSGRALLPFSLASFVLMGTTSATTGAIVGQHRSDQKSLLMVSGLVVQLLVALAFVRDHGLPALAWAQIAQYAVIFVAGWFLVVRNHFGSWTLRLPLVWRKDAFRELTGFGIKLQAVSIVGMTYDPLVKFLMSSMGGLAAVGFLEMAQRLIMQLRQIIVTPSLPLVPVFAHLLESEPRRLEALYQKALRISIILGVPLMASVALASPIISLIWLGHAERIFIMFLIVFSMGWLVNLIAAPGYLLGIGVGYVRWNLYGACLTAGGICLLGGILGHFLGSLGVALASSGMLAFGSALTMIMNCRALNIRALPHGSELRSAVSETYWLLVR
jgi:O-antigen/teichoic acid export membrane protein